MNLVYKALNRVIQCLSDCEVRFALIGGLAVSARSEPRFTRDVDLIVEAKSDTDAERLIHALLGRGYGIHAQLEQKTANRLATCRLVEQDQPAGRRDHRSVFCKLWYRRRSSAGSFRSGDRHRDFASDCSGRRSDRTQTAGCQQSESATRFRGRSEPDRGCARRPVGKNSRAAEIDGRPATGDRTRPQRIAGRADRDGRSITVIVTYG